MGKSLPYFLAVVIPFIVISVVVWRAILAARRQQRRRAVREARWEVYSDPAPGGKVRIGTRRVARWGDHEEVLMDDLVVEMSAGDHSGKLDAQVEAEQRMDFNNSLLPRLENG